MLQLKSFKFLPPQYLIIFDLLHIHVVNLIIFKFVNIMLLFIFINIQKYVVTLTAPDTDSEMVLEKMKAVDLPIEHLELVHQMP